MLVAAIAASAIAGFGITSYDTTIHSKPGKVVTRVSKKVHPAIVSFSYLRVTLDGKVMPYAEARGCEADFVSRRVMTTVDACSDRIRVSVASTGRTSRVVRVAIR